MTMKNAEQAIGLMRMAVSLRNEAVASAPEGLERKPDDARQYLLREAVAISREAQARPELMQALLLLAELEGDRQQYDEARALAEEAVSLARELGDSVLLANALRHLGAVHSHCGCLEQAGIWYHEALQLLNSRGAPPALDLAHVIRHLALLQEETGSYAAARHHWEKARQLYGLANATRGMAECRRHLALGHGEMEEGVVSDEDRAKLTGVIRGRPVCLVLHGHSLKDLPHYINEFPDVCFASVNRFWAIEPFIQPRQLELVMVICESLFQQFGPKINALPGLLISLDGSLGGIAYSCPGGPSLYGFLKLLIRSKVRRVFLFGADGYSTSTNPYVDGYLSGNTSQIDGHRRDTENFNAKFPRDTGDTQIFNVSPDSKYTALPKISYKECVSLLNAR